MIGGGMRQAGVLAAAGIVALEQMVDRLRDDHANALKLAQGINRIPGLCVNLANVQTNMVYFELDPQLAFDAEELCRRVAKMRVKVAPTGVRLIRAVTHCWVSREEIDEAVDAIRKSVQAS